MAYTPVNPNGQATSANSQPVVIASDQSAVPTYSAIPSGKVTRQIGQAVIAVTGTAVQLSATSYILQNGVIISAASGNNSAGGTIGASGVTNAVNGTGNGVIVAPGASAAEGSGVNLNTIYVNGTAGDIFSFLGS